MVAQLKPVEQLGMDEEHVDEPELEQALEDRQAKREAMSSARKVYDGAHEHAKALVEQLDMADDGAIRVGRFRIAKTPIPERHVVFDTKATVRISIGLVDEGDSEPGYDDTAAEQGAIKRLAAVGKHNADLLPVDGQASDEE